MGGLGGDLLNANVTLCSHCGVANHAVSIKKGGVIIQIRDKLCVGFALCVVGVLRYLCNNKNNLKAGIDQLFTICNDFVFLSGLRGLLKVCYNEKTAYWPKQ